MLLSLLTKGTIPCYHPAHLPVARIISKMSTLLLICRSLDPNQSPACGCHRKPFLLRTPGRRLLNLWHLLLPWPPSTEPKQKKSRPIFQTRLSKRKGAKPEPGDAEGRSGRVWRGLRSLEASRAASDLTSRCWASNPLPLLFTALPWINPLSVTPEMLSGRQACVASHVSRLLWYTLSSLILSDAPWLLGPSRPRSFRIYAQGLTPLIWRGDGGFFSFFLFFWQKSLLIW